MSKRARGRSVHIAWAAGAGAVLAALIGSAAVAAPPVLGWLAVGVSALLVLALAPVFVLLRLLQPFAASADESEGSLAPKPGVADLSRVKSGLAPVRAVLR
jgi:hypothetical protein